jgi:uncharacterized beta-barrel protein YwiB (DUF1934 family)
MGGMDKHVIISIRGSQGFPEFEEEDGIELITLGRLTREDGDYLITYQESPLTGLDGTTTTLRVADGRVILSRTGPVCSFMVFEQGRRHFSHYDTKEGPLTIGVSARRVKTRLDDAGGQIEVDYEIDVGEALTGENRIRVVVSEPGVH